MFLLQVMIPVMAIEGVWKGAPFCLHVPLKFGRAFGQSWNEVKSEDDGGMSD